MAKIQKEDAATGAIRLHLLLPDATLYCVRYSMINGRNLRCQVRDRRSIVVVNWCWRELQHSKKHVERRFHKILPFHLLWPSWSCLLMTASDQAPSTGVRRNSSGVLLSRYQSYTQQWAMNLHVNELTAGRLKLPQIIQRTHFVLATACHTDYRLTLRLLMSYIYGAPSKARNANVVYIWTYVW